MAEPETVFFVHVPKTGGTSFRSALEMAFPAERLAWDYGMNSPGTTAWVMTYLREGKDKKWLVQELAERDVAVFGGHVGQEQYGDVFSPERTIAFVRDPVERVLSEWHHHRRVSGMEMSLEEFVELPNVRNFQSQLLGGPPPSRYALLGLSRRFADSLELVRRRLGWDLANVVRNPNPDKSVADRYEISERDAALIRELNDVDAVLFEVAEKLFEHQWKLAAEEGAKTTVS
jgi:hypothetical protein